ncbi:MAG: hypothetical protein EAZ27_11230 [Cytophagales bacterium]|nr:MAG: hypothetical protein EAZ27_11230 [Cytophagales bacterium]
MKSNILPLQTETYYHIYNRGINGEDIFKVETNYSYFLNKYAKYIPVVAHTYAYCLLKNHFHLLIKTKTADEIKEFVSTKTQTETQTGFETLSALNISNLISKQFSDLFNGYAQGINKSFNRTGALFETPFRRISVSSDAYFSNLVSYIHTNPEKHGFIKDFRDYQHSSYHSHILSKPTKLMRESVISWFGGVNHYQQFHLEKTNEKIIKELIIEF